MSADLSRRAFLCAAMAAYSGLAARPVRAQGFAGLGMDADGFARVVPGHVLAFPRDHGAHPDFRIEWWYLTANLTGEDGAVYGLQWTLFRQAALPGPQREGFDNQQIWMAHAGLTSASSHFFAERFARGGIGQAGVEAKPFRAFIDGWEMSGGTQTSAQNLSPLQVTARGAEFSYSLHLTSERAVVLQGEQGFSQKSDRGQASYYYSQPYYTARGEITLKGQALKVQGRAWMDREWSSQPLAADQNGWDWFSLHLGEQNLGGEKLMLFRLRHADGSHYHAGNWIDANGVSTPLAADAIKMQPLATTKVGQRDIPTAWSLSIPSHGLRVETTALNPQSFMATRFPYWEGPIRFTGSHQGVGYLEMTGY